MCIRDSLWAVLIEDNIQIFQRGRHRLRLRQRAGVNEVVVCFFCRQAAFFQRCHIQKAKRRLFFAVLELEDCKAVRGAFQKRLLQLFLDDAAVHDRNRCLDRIPILAGNAEQTGVHGNILRFKRHCLAVFRKEHIHRRVMLHQLQRCLLYTSRCV